MKLNLNDYILKTQKNINFSFFQQPQTWNLTTHKNLKLKNKI